MKIESLFCPLVFVCVGARACTSVPALGRGRDGA